jgi:hypothetical protein
MHIDGSANPEDLTASGHQKEHEEQAKEFTHRSFSASRLVFAQVKKEKVSIWNFHFES